MSNIICLPGVPLTDPSWAAARRGLPAPNAGLVYDPEVLSDAEVIALMEGCSPRTPSGIRNRALLAVMWRAGLRCGEAVGREFRPRDELGHQARARTFPGIRVGDVHLTEATIRVVYGKGNARSPFKRRTVAIDPGGAALLELWLAKRRAMGIPNTVQVFCTISEDEGRYGGAWRPLSTAYVRNLCKRLALRAGLERRVHPHALRHTMAWNWAAAGVPMHVIQQQLGHESLSTTGRYLAHVAPLLLADAAREVPFPNLDHDELSAA